jgi:hypothetical protein
LRISNAMGLLVGGCSWARIGLVHTAGVRLKS